MSDLRIAVGIATVGRAQILTTTLDELARQSRAPDRTIVCAVGDEDVGDNRVRHPHVEFVLGPRGSSAQRNMIIDHVGDCDILLFLDDDFFPRPDYLSVLQALFSSNEDLMVATGTVLADGVTSAGISPEEARWILQADKGARDHLAMEPTLNGYGCNMAVRLSAVRRLGLRFDENLPHYGWLEDVDFTWQLKPCGTIMRAAGLRGVHLGVKLSRSSGVRLGYSQVVNPVYLCRKGTYAWFPAVRMIARQFAKNLMRAVHPESYVDRRGRLRGNLLGFADLLTGRADPRRILKL